MSERLDYPAFRPQARLVRGWADTLLGNPDGVRRAEEAWDEYGAMGIRLFLPFYLLLRAEALATVGDTAAAARLIVQSREVSAELGDVCLSPRLIAFAEALVPSAS